MSFQGIISTKSKVKIFALNNSFLFLKETIKQECSRLQIIELLE